VSDYLILQPKNLGRVILWNMPYVILFNDWHWL